MTQQWKLSEFTTLFAKGITTLFGSEEFLIIGEVSKIKQWNSRFYIELVEYNFNKVIAHAHAQIIQPSILQKPLQEWGMKPLELLGQQILMTCSVRYHKDYGFQLDIHSISSEYTLGSIQKKSTNIKQELISLGIIGANKSHKLGFPPFRIALISSPSSEGLKDFLDTLKDSDYKFSYELFETAIHGNTANQEIHKTLQIIYERVKNGEFKQLGHGDYQGKNEFDIVVIVRGGGGSSGIMRHNDLSIAKGICYMPIPVMMAVGHTSDSFLLDEIASYSAKTPTDAAYEIIGIYQFYSQSIENLYNQILYASKAKNGEYKTKILLLYKDIGTAISQKIQDYRKNIQNYYDFIMNSRPEKMLQSGYALLYNENSELMKKERIIDLQEGELLELKIYDRKIMVEIISNSQVGDN